MNTGVGLVPRQGAGVRIRVRVRAATSGRCGSNELRRVLDGITQKMLTQKMLTQTLRTVDWPGGVHG